VKLNSADFMRGGFTEEESADVVCVLGRLGVDQLEISGGTYENPVMTGEQGPSTRQREAYFLSYAAKVREVSDVPLVVTGGFRSVRAMGEALSHGATDFIGLARPLALVPDLPAKVLSQEDYRVDLPQLTTGVATLDQLATLNVSWYEHQLQRIARGLAPNPKMSEWSSLGRVLRDYGVCLLHKRRVAHYGRKREGRMP
jgi:2,4-dienoyl-CoA reductase-like NADH-dependent reductase (Old Yellow Enzyme family)